MGFKNKKNRFSYFKSKEIIKIKKKSRISEAILPNLKKSYEYTGYIFTIEKV